jgi:hypothetical protein
VIPVTAASTEHAARRVAQRGMPFPAFIGYNERQLEETMSFA